jgi:soluble lytic murein transglycosylase-like protein
MTIGIGDKPSLLTSLLTNSSRETADGNSAGQTAGLFADKLDSILTGDGQAARTEQSKAQSLAQVLNLQMLHSTLALAGEGSSESPLPTMFGRQTANLQTLVNTYSANLPDSAGQPATVTEDSTQLHELSESPARASSQPATETQGGQWLDPVIAKASRRYGVDTSLIKAVIKAESNFNPTAVSHAGARGLMQLMPGTARSLGVSDSFDPEQNVMAGTRFLRDLLDRYNGNVDSALAAYNWGPGNVDKRPDHLPRETRDYLVRVKQLYASYSA